MDNKLSSLLEEFFESEFSKDKKGFDDFVEEKFDKVTSLEDLSKFPSDLLNHECWIVRDEIVRDLIDEELQPERHQTIYVDSLIDKVDGEYRYLVNSHAGQPTKDKLDQINKLKYIRDYFIENRIGSIEWDW